MTTAARQRVLWTSLLLLATSAMALAATNPAAVCTSAKRNAAAKKAKGKLGCAAKAAGAGAAVDPACLTTQETRFQTAYAKAEAKGAGSCLTSMNAGSVEATVDACVGNIRSALGASASTLPKSACLAAKLKAAAKKLASKVKCTTVAALKGAPVSATCLSSAESKFATAMAKAETKGACVLTGDAAAAESAVDQCLANLVAAEPAPTTTTTTTTTITTTTDNTSSTTLTTTTSTTTTTQASMCDTEPAAFAGITAQHNATRANAMPTPNPALEPLCWDNTVAADAQAWANGCTYAHDPNLGTLSQGQNIYAAAQTVGFPPTAAQDAEPDWASEVADYNYTNNSCSSVCGHYTQVVWRDTEVVGCGIKNCTTNSPFGAGFPNWTIVVCNYQPPGNFIGERPY